MKGADEMADVRMFQSPEELQILIDEYMALCAENGDITDIEGLAVFLGTTRKTLWEYEYREEFSNTIKRAKDKIFNNKKQLAMKGKMNPIVFIFDAKNNHNYTDKQEVEATNHNLNDDISSLTDEELLSRLEAHKHNI